MKGHAKVSRSSMKSSILISESTGICRAVDVNYSTSQTAATLLVRVHCMAFMSLDSHLRPGPLLDRYTLDLFALRTTVAGKEPSNHRHRGFDECLLVMGIDYDFAKSTF